jgi:anti-anti-sigma factor
MELKTVTQDDVTIVELSGSLDGTSAPQVQGEVMPLVVPNCRLVLDMSGCEYVSSAGLRVLLMVAKLLTSKEGRGALAGLSEEILDVMEMTGFAQFFDTYDTVSQAVEAIREEA